MPLYQYRCAHGCWQDTYLSLSQFHEAQFCMTHGLPMERIIGAPSAVKVAPDLCYDSPIDGQPITSHHARLEDLKRSNCVPYDPEMKSDYQQRIKDGEAKLDRAVDEFVEAKCERMSTKERAKVWSELVDQGADIELQRLTKGA